MKNAVFFLLKDYADWQGAYLSSRLNMSKEWTIKTASLKKEMCKSIGGFTTVIDYSLKEVPKSIDLLLLIGGDSWSIEDEDLSKLISLYLKKGVIVGAICGAVDFLARNGQLNNYKHTGNSLNLLKKYRHYDNEENFIREQAVADRNLITANGTAPIELSESALKALNFKSPEKIEKEHELLKIGLYKYSSKYGDPHSS